MNKSLTILTSAGMAFAVFTVDTANAQRGGNRDNPGGRIGGSNRGSGGNSGRQNSGSQQSIGRTLQNQLQNRVRNEVGNAIGLPSRGNQRFNDRSFGQQRNGNSLSRQTFSNRNNQFGNGSRQRGRYRSNPLASLIVSQFPEARRILSPRGAGYGSNRGAFYRDNNRYYYYPQAYASSQYPNGYQSQPSGVQLSGGAIVSSGGSVQQAGGTVQQQVQPVEVPFGQFAYTDQLSEVLTTVLNDLCLDMHYNYSHNANYSAVYREAFAALTEAKGMNAAQQTDNRETIKQRLKLTDSILHKLEPQVQGWTRNHQKQVGEAGMLTKLEIAGDVTHHMMHDAGISQEEHDEANHASTTAEAAEPVEQAPAPQ